ncbi:MAG: hypothetical protein K1X95_16520 [Acidimicrobiia bacterium]|nr:hypothetical protein [Acidimicrobiia bacterium]
MLATVWANPILGALLDGKLPEHAKGEGAGVMWTIIFPLLGLVLLGGSIWLILSTDVGGKRSFQLCLGAFLTYLFFHSLTWIITGNGYKVQPEGYFATRIVSMILALVCLAVVAVLFYVWHQNERATQRIDED